ncbi:spore germination protein [Alicyclobacillus contaminans]|uniref:spore germination protein n=1 Tax=Alicyclobacillus contaminans TaxID=392016 RepID=UPI000685C2B3|nr:spore germination protein [Alicyclobacillus contaminans]
MTTAMERAEQTPISSRMSENVEFVHELLGIGTTWDIIQKPFHYDHVHMTTYIMNGFFMTTHVLLLMQNFEQTVEAFAKEYPADKGYTAHELMEYLNTHLPFVQVQVLDKMSDVIRFILSGPMVTFIEGCNQALLVDTRVYPMRSISNPQVERVIRGPADSFTETMLLNCAMIRRRLRDPRLRIELMQIGARSQTDVSLLYLQDVTSEQLVDDIRARLKGIRVDSLAMADQAVAELIGKVRWNPYPIVRYTERPDVATTALLDGHVLIVVDTSPEVIIAPVTFFQHLQHPQEYHSYPMIGTYLRWVILLSVLMSVFLPGVFLVVNAHPTAMPRRLSFFIASRDDPLPLFVELLVAELALDILRLAVINTPSTLASAVGIVAAMLFGDFSTHIHLLQPEVLVYMGFVMIAQFATSSFELATANQMARFWIIVWTGFFRGWGFAIACITWFLLLYRTRSFGIPYLWPLIPFQWRNGLREILFRRPTAVESGRPPIFQPKIVRRKG